MDTSSPTAPDSFLAQAELVDEEEIRRQALAATVQARAELWIEDGDDRKHDDETHKDNHKHGWRKYSQKTPWIVGAALLCLILVAVSLSVSLAARGRGGGDSDSNKST